MNTSYETDRLALRICTKYDARMVLDFYNKNLEDFAKYEVIDLDACRTLKYHEKMLNAEFSVFSQGRMARFYIFEKNNPFQIIGTFAFHDIQFAHYLYARVGYKVDKDYRRRGYAKEAIGKGIEIMFDEVGLHRIEAFVMPENRPSICLLESLGFNREGLITDKVMLNGKWRHHYLYAKINADN